MKLFRYFVALVAVLLLSADMWAQNTAPVPVSFKIAKPKKCLATNVIGNLLPDNSVTLVTDRPDTLAAPQRVRAVLRDASDSTHLVFDVTSQCRNFTPVAEQVTVAQWQQLHLPQSTGGGARVVDDSLFQIVLNQSTMSAGMSFEIVISEVGEDEPAAYNLYFEDDTVRGAASDTSAIVDISRGAQDVVFGFKSSGSSPGVDYVAEYNMGWGWGLTSPPDTLAGSGWTAAVPANTWRFRRVGEIADALFLRVIRTGTVAADTNYTRQTLTITPRE